MAKTYLQLINSVRSRLRDSDATTLTDNADVILIAALVNQAKEQVETMWKWQALRKTITFNSVIGTASYDTSNALVATVTQTNELSVLLWDAEHSELPLFWDVTANGEFRMGVTGRDAVVDYIRTTASNTAAQPGLAAVYQNGNGLQVLFADVPTAVRNYSFEAYSPQAELTVSSTTVLAPWQPIRDLTIALVAEERGDLFGQPSSRYFDFYRDSLEMAISNNKDNQYDDAMTVV